MASPCLKILLPISKKPNNMIKAVVFDMDGTMPENEDIHSRAFELILKEYGKIPIYNKYDKY